MGLTLSRLVAEDAGGEVIIVSKIAPGSCVNEDREPPMRESIVAQNPDRFLFSGDNVYADTEDMKDMQAGCDKLAAMPGDQRLLKTWPVLAQGLNYEALRIS